MVKPRISVVIPCFNHGEFLGEAVASVLGLGRDDVELVVVDDGSTDEGTRHEMEMLREQGIQVVRQENKGLSAARNAGVRAAHGEYIFPLDADDRMRGGGWIDRAIGIFGSRPEVGVVFGDAEFFGMRTGRSQLGALDVERLLARNYIFASALFRRTVWQQNGGYDEGMVGGFEDWDFWVGAIEQRWQFEYLPEVFFEYRRASESMLTRAYAVEPETADFVGRKHGRLYKDVLFSVMAERDLLSTQHRSVRRTAKNLSRLLGVRFREKLRNAFGNRGRARD
jgi:glycosyltransferase involved in cell wall biosynthesis